MATLPEIPGTEDLGSRVLEAHPLDLTFNPPAMKNGWGQAQTTRDISGVQAITFPPHAVCCRIRHPWHTGYMSTGELFLDGCLLTSRLAPHEKLEFQWFPDRIRRRVAWNGWRVETESFMPWGGTALVQRIIITRLGSATQSRIAFHAGASPGTFPDGESVAEPVCEANPLREYDSTENAFMCRDGSGGTVVLEGFVHETTGRMENGLVHFEVPFERGQTREWWHILACGSDPAEAARAYAASRTDPPALQRLHSATVNRHLRAAFTGEGGFWSGQLPVLRTSNPHLWRLYHSALVTVWASLADIPGSRIGRGYRAIGPRIHATRIFPWDTALAAKTLVFLDPEPMKALVLHWLGQPLDRHSHSCCLNGTMFGNWYPANHWAVTRLAYELVASQDDHAWLSTSVAGRSTWDRLQDQAARALELLDPGTGLVDCSGSYLLEVVPHYRRITAGFNAMWSESMDHLDSIGSQVKELNTRWAQQACRLRKDILRHLTAGDSGSWRCISGKEPRELCHVHDFLTVMNAFPPGELPDRLRRAMISVFEEKLQTDNWVRALGADGTDCLWSLRADHGWCGAYPAWPARAALGLVRQGCEKGLAAWMTGLARSASQGPWGQAHLTGFGYPDVGSGAAKAPPEPPYQNEWYCLGGAAFGDFVMEGVFGLGARDPAARESAERLRQSLDPDARLITG
jgi:hypothetical protein